MKDPRSRFPEIGCRAPDGSLCHTDAGACNVERRNGHGILKLHLTQISGTWEVGSGKRDVDSPTRDVCATIRTVNREGVQIQSQGIDGSTTAAPTALPDPHPPLSLAALTRRACSKGVCRRHTALLARVQEVLQGDELLVGLDEVHARLVVGEEDRRVALQHRLELGVQRAVVAREEADEVVHRRDVRAVHGNNRFKRWFTNDL
eukprot:gene732-biopygen7746